MDNFLGEAKWQSGQCKECLPKVMIVIKSAGRSTYGLHIHLQTKHGVKLFERTALKRKSDGDHDITESIVQPTNQNVSFHVDQARGW